MLSRWDPFTEIARLHDQLSRAAGDFEGTSLASNSSFAPAVDIHETKDAFFVAVELPGLMAADVNVTADHGILTIRGERKLATKDDQGRYQRIERSYGTFTRSFSLPQTVDADELEADLADGVLTVKLPKRSAPEPKRIQVRSAGERPIKGGQPS